MTDIPVTDEVSPPVTGTPPVTTETPAIPEVPITPETPVEPETRPQEVVEPPADTITPPEAQTPPINIDDSRDEASLSIPAVYLVQSGDSLISISNKFYGDASMVEEIIKLNDLKDANMIFSGKELLLPQP